MIFEARRQEDLVPDRVALGPGLGACVAAFSVVPLRGTTGSAAMDPPVISRVSARTALVASILGPMITLAVARRQTNATVVSSNRQKGIEAIRDQLAELISCRSPC